MPVRLCRAHAGHTRGRKSFKAETRAKRCRAFDFTSSGWRTLVALDVHVRSRLGLDFTPCLGLRGEMVRLGRLTGVDVMERCTFYPRCLENCKKSCRNDDSSIEKMTRRQCDASSPSRDPRAVMSVPAKSCPSNAMPSFPSQIRPSVISLPNPALLCLEFQCQANLLLLSPSFNAADSTSQRTNPEKRSAVHLGTVGASSPANSRTVLPPSRAASVIVSLDDCLAVRVPARAQT